MAASNSRLYRRRPPESGGSAGRSGAFTLMEMVAVMGIIVVLTAFTLPAVVSLVGSQNLTAGTSRVSEMLVLARSEAIARHSLTRFVIVTKWPGEPERAYRQFGIWIWDQRDEDFVPLTDWESLPNGVLFEAEQPSYIEHAEYSRKDATSTRGDYVLSNADSAFTLRVQKTDVELQYVEFIPTGAARLTGGTMQKSLFVLVEGFQKSPGRGPIVYTGGDIDRPKNWSQVNLENLTGRVQIYRP